MGGALLCICNKKISAFFQKEREVTKINWALDFLYKMRYTVAEKGAL